MQFGKALFSAWINLFQAVLVIAIAVIANGCGGDKPADWKGFTTGPLEVTPQFSEDDFPGQKSASNDEKQLDVEAKQ